MTARGYCFPCLEYGGKNMECCARLNTCLTKPREAQEKGPYLCGSFIVCLNIDYGANVAF